MVGDKEREVEGGAARAGEFFASGMGRQGVYYAGGRGVGAADIDVF